MIRSRGVSESESECLDYQNKCELLALACNDKQFQKSWLLKSQTTEPIWTLIFIACKFACVCSGWLLSLTSITIITYWLGYGCCRNRANRLNYWLILVIYCEIGYGTISVMLLLHNIHANVVSQILGASFGALVLCLGRKTVVTNAYLKRF